SNQVGTINLNRWDNGKIIIEFLDPIQLNDANRENLRVIINEVHGLMSDKIEKLSIEAAAYHNK
ncbi:MAG TPA: 1-acyl-sn-glycerol-3-phosphate acyltransferase, partial [Colwellia sp.]|nr:1-acyl-sn-glycerol-3-phosphate acyltransferase [Colwellia sp.]